MMKKPTISTLFPYTTLFRSCVGHCAHNRKSPTEHCFNRLSCDGTRYRDKQRILVQLSRLKQDRKSTRLNSSHVEISYAVFCLKKKKPDNSNGNHNYHKLDKI